MSNRKQIQPLTHSRLIPSVPKWGEINDSSCDGVICNNICVDGNLHSQKCVDGTCVPDQLLEINSESCNIKESYFGTFWVAVSRIPNNSHDDGNTMAAIRWFDLVGRFGK